MRDIPGLEELYAATEDGRIWSHLSKKFRKPVLRKGYGRLMLRKNGKYIPQDVHRLVAKTFIPNPKNLPMVNHKDGNRQNNSVENLEWCTHQENNQHAIKVLKSYESNGGVSKLTDEQIDDIRTSRGVFNQVLIGIAYGLKRSAVNNIMCGRSNKNRGKLYEG